MNNNHFSYNNYQEKNNNFYNQQQANAGAGYSTYNEYQKLYHDQFTNTNFVSYNLLQNDVHYEYEPMDVEYEVEYMDVEYEQEPMDIEAEYPGLLAENLAFGHNTHNNADEVVSIKPKQTDVQMEVQIIEKNFINLFENDYKEIQIHSDENENQNNNNIKKLFSLADTCDSEKESKHHTIRKNEKMPSIGNKKIDFCLGSKMFKYYCNLTPAEQIAVVKRNNTWFKYDNKNIIRFHYRLSPEEKEAVVKFNNRWHENEESENQYFKPIVKHLATNKQHSTKFGFYLRKKNYKNSYNHDAIFRKKNNGVKSSAILEILLRSRKKSMAKLEEISKKEFNDGRIWKSGFN